MSAEPYGTSIDEVRDRLEAVRLALLHIVIAQTQARNNNDLPDPVAASFLAENFDAASVPVPVPLAQAIADVAVHVEKRVAATQDRELRWSQICALHQLDDVAADILLITAAPHFASGFTPAFRLAFPDALTAAGLSVLAALDVATVFGRTRGATYAVLRGLIDSGLVLTNSASPWDIGARVALSPVLLDELADLDVDRLVSHLAPVCNWFDADSDLSCYAEESADQQTILRFARHLARTAEHAAISSTGHDPGKLAARCLAATGTKCISVNYVSDRPSADVLTFYRKIALVARLVGAGILVRVGDESAEDPAVWVRVRELLGCLAGIRCVVVCSGSAPVHTLAAAPLAHLRLGALSVAQRTTAWRLALRSAELLPVAEVQDLGHSYSLSETEIHDVVWQAATRRRFLPPGPCPNQVLHELARASLNKGIEHVADRVETSRSFDDLVIDAECRQKLLAIIAFIRFVDRQGTDAASRGARSIGAGVLLHGASGTGKTMAAGLLAREAGKDAYRIDVSRVVDKYIGETEKQLERVFALAEASGSVLIFDEADSLFARRTAVKSSVDRYANMHVNYLLQRLDSYRGVCILTTNLADSLDDAFRRRIPFQVEFKAPGSIERARLWKDAVLRLLDHDLADGTAGRLAEGLPLTGAHICNAVLKAAAACNSAQGVTFEVLHACAHEEYAALGHVVRKQIVTERQAPTSAR